MAGGAFPRWIGRELLLALRDLIGAYNLESILRIAHIAIPAQDAPLTRDVAFADIAHLTAALVELYGEKEGARLMRRAGYQALRNAWHSWRAAPSLRLACWLLPAPWALALALWVLSGIWNQHTDESVKLGAIPQGYRWCAEPCGFCDPPAAWAWMQGVLEGLLDLCDIPAATVACVECNAETRRCVFEITLDKPIGLK